MPNPVVIVKAPSGTTENKRFLGYEWSDSKGNEGIKYMNIGGKTSSNDEEGDAEDDDTMQQIRGINGIQTPLFNPSNLADNDKINTVIRKNFEGSDFIIPDELTDIISIGHLVDMIDFKRTAFSKEVKTNVPIQVERTSKWPLVTLSDVCKDIFAGGDKPQNYTKEKTEINTIPIFSNGVDNNGLFGFTNVAKVIEPCVTISARGTLGFCVLHSQPFYPIVRLIVAIPNDNIDIQYFKHILDTTTFINEGASTPQLSVPKIRLYKIPLPPLPLQQQIANACAAIDKECQAAHQRMEDLKSEMETIMVNAQSHTLNTIKLNRTELFSITIGRRVLKSEITKDGTFDVFSANVFEPFGKTNHSVLSDFSKPSVLWGIDGDWMVNYRPSKAPFNPTDHCGVIRVLDETVVNPRYLVYPLLKAGEAERFSRANRASTERIKALSIMLPDINVQNEVAEKLIELETEMLTLKDSLSKCAEKKQVILDKYLK